MNNSAFYVLSLLSIIFSLFVVISRNPIHSILSLILVFFNIAGFFILLGAEYLAMLFIIVYIGAVAVLFLFIVMMLDIKLVDLTISMYRYTPIFIILGFVFFLESLLTFCNDLTLIDTKYSFFSFFGNYCLFDNFSNNWGLLVFPFVNVVHFSNYIYTYFLFLFIVSGIILLVSMIGAISLTLHRRNDIKRQYIYKQITRGFSDSILWKG